MVSTITFLKLVPQAPNPTRADATLSGTVPLRAYQHCIPFTQASAFGWHVYPPIDFSLMWTGTGFQWKPRGHAPWHPLSSAQIPGFSAWFAQHAPPNYKRLEPPFLNAFPEHGVVQVWSGYAARMRRGWSLLIRAPVNEVNHASFDCLEGIVEHDWWCGPIISNLRFKQTDQEVRFRTSKALFQLVPIPKFAFSKKTLSRFTVKESLSDLDQADWSGMSEAMFPGGEGKQRPGGYARAVRKQVKQDTT